MACIFQSDTMTKAFEDCASSMLTPETDGEVKGSWLLTESVTSLVYLVKDMKTIFAESDALNCLLGDRMAIYFA